VLCERRGKNSCVDSEGFLDDARIVRSLTEPRVFDEVEGTTGRSVVKCMRGVTTDRIIYAKYAFLRNNSDVQTLPGSLEGSCSELRVLYGGKLLHFLMALVAGLVSPCSS